MAALEQLRPLAAAFAEEDGEADLGEVRRGEEQSPRRGGTSPWRVLAGSGALLVGAAVLAGQGASPGRQAALARPVDLLGFSTIVAHPAESAAASCGMAEEGSACYDDVVWAMTTGITKNPAWYKGLSKKSSFEDFQAHLSKGENATCSQPCKKPGCETASPGSVCWENVQWAKTDGIKEHPGWYDGLANTSPMEAFQDHIHRDNATACPKQACNVQPYKPVTLFCWAVVRPEGSELGLIRAQLDNQAGIFACDGHAIVSEKDLNLDGTKTLLIKSTKATGYTGDGTSPNAPIFVDAWEAIRVDGQYASHEWIVKVDPDTVLIPMRLRKKLAAGKQPPDPYPTPFTPKPGAGQWVTNCDKMAAWGAGWGNGWPMMYGSVEIISLDAINTYYENLDLCKGSFAWQGMGEDAFMGLCLRKLEVGELFMKQGDGNCAGGACTDDSFQAYHPRKDVTSWMQCWGEATR